MDLLIECTVRKTMFTNTGAEKEYCMAYMQIAPFFAFKFCQTRHVEKVVLFELDAYLRKYLD